MRILNITDTHTTAKNPASRLDSYYVATVKKFYEIGMVIKREKIDLVLHNGDFFHTPRVSLKYAGVLADIVRGWGVPVHVVPGNHDTYGYNMDTIDQTMLGMFAKTGVVNILSRANLDVLTFDVDGYELSIEGQEYYADIDKGNPNDYKVSNLVGDYKILAIHNMTMPKSYLPDVPHTLIKDIVTNADLVTAGHYHPGWDEVEYNGTVFCNPGSALRVDATDHNKTVPPKMLILDVHKGAMGLECTRTYLPFASAKPGTDIFDYAAKLVKKQSINLLNTFKTTIQNTAVLQQATTIPDMVQAIAQLTNVEASIVKSGLTYIANAQTVSDDAVPEVKGFIEKLGRIWITKLEGENFQSWEKINVDFTNGLNIIVGESNHGKTAMLRLLLWVLFNDPKGTDFIRAGHSEVWGKIYFSDGSSIERRRTVSNAGSYIVTTAAGDVKTYTGFNNDIPPEVMNEHQMPEVYLAKDFKVRLNVASQLDKPFLVSESPYVKAAAVGRLIGTQVVDAAIKNVNADKLSSEKRIKVLKKEIEGRNQDLKKYDGLADMKLFIDAYGYLIEVQEGLEKHRADMQFTYIDYTDNRLKIDKVQQALASTPNLDSQELLIEQAMRLVNELETLSSLQGELQQVRGDIFDVWSSNQKLYGLYGCEEVIAKAEELALSVKVLSDYRLALISYKQQISDLSSLVEHQDVTSIEYFINEAFASIENISEGLSLINELDKVRRDMTDVEIVDKSLKTCADDALVKIAEIEGNMAKYLEDIGACPTCGGALTQEHIEHIIKEG